MRIIKGDGSIHINGYIQYEIMRKKETEEYLTFNEHFFLVITKAEERKLKMTIT